MHGVWNGTQRGWYEVFFLLLNDVTQDLALWLRWLVVAPQDRRHSPTTSVWGMATCPGRSPLAMREVFPGSAWTAEPDGVRIGGNIVSATGSTGTVFSLDWQLHWADAHPPEQLYPYRWMYRAPWPRTKYATPMPAVSVSGTIRVGDTQYVVRDVPGYVGHLWGTQMAEAWAWVQCATFADAPGARLEALSARVRVGPAVTPPLTLATLWADGQCYRFNGLRSWCAETEWTAAGWHLVTRDAQVRLRLECDAPQQSVAGLTYVAPDASRRYCYHSDRATLRVELALRHKATWRVVHQLVAPHSARFETVSRRPEPGLPLLI